MELEFERESSKQLELLTTTLLFIPWLVLSSLEAIEEELIEFLESKARFQKPKPTTSSSSSLAVVVELLVAVVAVVLLHPDVGFAFGGLIWRDKSG